MKVIFFNVDDVLNFPGTEAKAPSGRVGVAESGVKYLKDLAKSAQAFLVLIGSWTKDWDFEDSKCSEDGVYLVKKLDRKGLHIMDKTDDINTWLSRHPNVTDYCVLSGLEVAKWIEI